MTLDLGRFLPYRLDRISDAVSRHFQPVYRDQHAMTRPEWKVFAHLGQADVLTAREIVAQTGLHKTKVSRAIASLEKRRWLKRERDAADRRVEHLTLTPLGRKSHTELSRLLVRREDDLLAHMTETERQTVANALAILERIVPRAD
jgi:DNA-binding MarR family transcriptional regulator